MRPMQLLPRQRLQAEAVHTPQVTCSKHAKEQVRVLCMGCEHGVCLLCAVDTKGWKTHATDAFHTLLEELHTDVQGWVRAQEVWSAGVAASSCAAASKRTRTPTYSASRLNVCDCSHAARRRNRRRRAGAAAAAAAAGCCCCVS